MLVGILAAGEGSRLQEVAQFKPLVMVGGIPLAQRTLQMVDGCKPEQIMVIFNEREQQMDLTDLPALHQPNTQYFFQTTPSSLHSLFAIMQRLKLGGGEHILISMVDSILPQNDFDNFYKYCAQLPIAQSAVLTTAFIEDENPLTVSLGDGDIISDFQVPLQKSRLITSGMYCFSSESFCIMQSCIDNGMMKMRNFLTALVSEGQIVHSFEVEKSLDIDRPEDIKSAELFLEQK